MGSLMHSVTDGMRERTHQCTSQPGSVRIEKDGGYFKKVENWVLVVSRSAAEEDLEENHYLEEVGEEMWSTVVEISHCPYCGRFLGKIQGQEVEIAHFDHSGWNSTGS